MHHVFLPGPTPPNMARVDQAEVGEGLMMISYGYSGAGKTTTLCLGQTAKPGARTPLDHVRPWSGVFFVYSMVLFDDLFCEHRCPICLVGLRGL